MDVLIAESFGFLVILFVLYRYVWPILRSMSERQQEAIQKMVDDSEHAQVSLEEAQRRLASALAEARDETAKIRDTARGDADKISEELREQAEREVERIRQRGEEQLIAARDQMVRQLRVEVGRRIMGLTERLVVETLADTKGKRSAVDHFLDELDEMTATEIDGGRPGESRESSLAGARDEGRL